MNYGVIGNCQVAAVIDEQARFVWACLPRPDGDPVFSALLQKEGGGARDGVFAVDMLDLTRVEQEYLRNSAILETRMYDAHGGVMRVVDFAPRFRTRGRVFRPMMFVRMVEPVSGRPALRLRLRPTMGFGGRCAPGISGSHHVRFAAEGLHYRLTTDASLAAVLENRPVVLEQPLHFIIGPDETLQESPAALSREFFDATLSYWREWVPVAWSRRHEPGSDHGTEGTGPRAVGAARRCSDDRRVAARGSSHRERRGPERGANRPDSRQPRPATARLR